MPKAFDRIAPYYDRWVGRFMSGRMDRMATILSPSLEETILDLGGGTGLFAGRLIGRCKEIHLLDESPRMVEQVPCKGIVALVGSGTEIPYTDRFFDAIVLSDVFHHINDQDRVLDEVTRVLKSGGRLLVNEPDQERFMGRALGVLESLFFGQIHYTGFQEINRKLETRGFRLVSKSRDCWSFIGLWRSSRIIRGASGVLCEVP